MEKRHDWVIWSQCSLTFVKENFMKQTFIKSSLFGVATLDKNLLHNMNNLNTAINRSKWCLYDANMSQNLRSKVLPEISY